MFLLFFIFDNFSKVLFLIYHFKKKIWGGLCFSYNTGILSIQIDMCGITFLVGDPKRMVEQNQLRAFLLHRKWIDNISYQSIALPKFHWGVVYIDYRTILQYSNSGVYIVHFDHLKDKGRISFRTKIQRILSPEWTASGWKSYLWWISWCGSQYWRGRQRRARGKRIFHTEN